MSEQEETPLNTELGRLDKFVDAAPRHDYTIDQTKQQLCRQLPNGQQQCIHLNLECKSLDELESGV
ncbi:uncharacterized protein BYT42DRAFT_571348 [Radiomyces spectabilis]|uniref:uncharacterized protein n=1 Tax=Radiomyces spectabilis TaxID=64574 RepID=UPI00221F4F84|nr:uncharacterized protein BYT42DRAFT_571348 [Radiomyces spectabilis]KAI8377719.1 hypothetical protein BYT42DRAFT_571348 [Radiomyces spectabilis]